METLRNQQTRLNACTSKAIKQAWSKLGSWKLNLPTCVGNTRYQLALMSLLVRLVNPSWTRLSSGLLFSAKKLHLGPVECFMRLLQFVFYRKIFTFFCARILHTLLVSAEESVQMCRIYLICLNFNRSLLGSFSHSVCWLTVVFLLRFWHVMFQKLAVDFCCIT